MSKVIPVTSPHHFTQLLSSSRIVIADCWAEWCGPCKAIAPVYEQLATQLSRPGQITFAKIDTEAQKDIARTYNITALPTFLIFKAGREVKRVRGADPKGLNEAVKQLATEAGKADEMGEASGSGSGGAGSWMGAQAPRGYEDVTGSVDMLGLDFLNLGVETSDKRVLFEGGKPSSLGMKGKAKQGSKKDWVESDTDEQLMLFVPFQATVKLHSIHITTFLSASSEGNDDDEEAPMRPKTLKLYTNRPHVVGFDEADDTPCTQEITLKSSDWDAKTGTARVELRFVKFQNISSLVIFVVDGEGEGEKTRIDRLRFFGETGEKRAMGKLEKVGDERIEAEKSIGYAIRNILRLGDFVLESHQAAEAQYLIFSTADFQRQRYDVVAAVMHRGEHTHSGHYAVYRKQGAHWLLMGDGKATRVLPEDVKDDSEASAKTADEERDSKQKLEAERLPTKDPSPRTDLTANA
ncbi:Thioredoxin-like protein 1 [Friedmanniomyces endolithicus]|nr:Thioredoxin-like protein 1 [Friedmanniomyces endolithicus]